MEAVLVIRQAEPGEEREDGDGLERIKDIGIQLGLAIRLHFCGVTSHLDLSPPKYSRQGVCEKA